MEDEAKERQTWWAIITSMKEWQIRELLRLKEQVLSYEEFRWADEATKSDGCGRIVFDMLIRHCEAMAGIHELFARQSSVIYDLMKDGQKGFWREVTEIELIEERKRDLEELVDLLYEEQLRQEAQSG